MNVGDKIAVTIQGIEVAKAEVKEVSDGTATLIVPATRVVMATKTELAPEVGPSGGEGTQVVVDEVVRTTETAPASTENAGGEVAQPSNNDVTVADKVITSSSVPTPNDAATDHAKALAELPQAVQDQIASIVAAHNAAQTAAETGSDSAAE